MNTAEKKLLEQTIQNLFDDYIRMYTSRDDKIISLFSENFTGFTGGGNSLVKDREEWVKITRQDFAQVQEPIHFGHKDRSIQMLSETVTVATGFFTIHLPIKDRILSNETARLVLIFCKEFSGWKISHSSISIPYYLVQAGEIYPLKELENQNRVLEELISERTFRLSTVNDDLKKSHRALEQEIIERKRAEEAADESVQKWNALILASPDGIGMVTLDGKIQLISEKLVRMHGGQIENLDQLKKKSVFDYIHPKSHKLLLENLHKLITGKKEQNITEYVAVKEDGSQFIIDVNASILYDKAGNPASILYVERDITERKRVEQALRESEEQHRLLFETALEGIIVAQGSKLSYFNPKMLEITGYTSFELQSINFMELVHADDNERISNNYKRRMSGEIIEQKYQFRSIRKDKSTSWLEMSSVKLEWKGQPAILSFINDITENKLAELELIRLNEELQLSKKAVEENLVKLNHAVNELLRTKEELENSISQKDKFFSIIAHDLKSPFVGFLGLTEIMVEDAASCTAEELAEMGENMHKTAHNLFKLLKNLLEWAEMQKGTMSFTPREFSLTDLIKEIIETIKKRGEQKGISIVNNIFNPIDIFADDKMISSVVLNLISNAVKFTNRNGSVEVNSKFLDAEMLEISVSDTGVGISENMMSKLFKVGENSGTKGTDGELSTGLGLILCKEFVEKHGGKIWAESKKNVGSTFSFTIKLTSH